MDPVAKSQLGEKKVCLPVPPPAYPYCQVRWALEEEGKL